MDLTKYNFKAFKQGATPTTDIETHDILITKRSKVVVKKVDVFQVYFAKIFSLYIFNFSD